MEFKRANNAASAAHAVRVAAPRGGLGRRPLGFAAMDIDNRTVDITDKGKLVLSMLDVGRDVQVSVDPVHCFAAQQCYFNGLYSPSECPRNPLIVA
ncbi:MAG: hypothetical protein ACR2PM_01005 [Hyphomicrobiales bacterium]